MPLDQITKDRPKTKALKIPALSKAEIAALGSDKPQIVRITKPKLRTTAVTITGISPYVQHKFSEKSRRQMEATQEAGQQARGKKTREAKDFDAVYEAAKHYSQDGWIGIPASAFRNAMIDACRLIGFKMTLAKLSIFVEADGIDRDEGTPLVRIIGQPRIHKGFARNATGVADIRWRPMWETVGRQPHADLGRRPVLGDRRAEPAAARRNAGRYRRGATGQSELVWHGVGQVQAGGV